VAGGRENDRAQLWCIYFGMLAIADPPAFLERARAELKAHLEGGPPPTSAVLGRRHHLRRVK